jgi:LacI family transcriptional regulator
VALPDPPAFAPSAPDSRKAAVTIKDVAKVAGVHFTTVSLALRDHPSLPPTTRQRIRAVADKMGYVRNPVFAALTHFHLRGRVRAVAPRIGYLVNHTLDRGAALYQLQRQTLLGALEQARLLGFDFEVVGVQDHGFDSDRLTRFLDSRHITGIVLAGFDPRLHGIELDWTRFSVVKIDSLHMEPQAPVVGSDHRQDVRLALKRLQQLGYRRIGLAVGRADEDATERLYSAGYLLEQRTMPREERVPELLLPCVCTQAQAGALVGNWARRHKLDAVMCNWPGIGEMLAVAGLRVPQDIACVSLCLLKPDGSMAGVYRNPRVIGAKAVALVNTLLKAGERGVPEFASRTYVRSQWHDGDSAPVKTDPTDTP